MFDQKRTLRNFNKISISDSEFRPGGFYYTYQNFRQNFDVEQNLQIAIID